MRDVEVHIDLNGTTRPVGLRRISDWTSGAPSSTTTSAKP